MGSSEGGRSSAKGSSEDRRSSAKVLSGFPVLSDEDKCLGRLSGSTN